ncbi:MAG: hypothetical protein Tsb0013_20880 [Phycisphaerales bacterium]
MQRTPVRRRDKQKDTPARVLPSRVMMPANKADWATRLRRVAARTLGDDLGAGDWQRDRLTAFSDERGHRRAVDPYLLAWRGRGEGVETLPPPTHASEACLWASLTRTDTDLHAHLPERSDEEAPLFEQPDDVVIEVWTETELASLHAVWWHAHTTGDASLRALVRDVASWHVAMLQPDNATNHPWALHVFLLLHTDHGVEGADLYAQTLLHNCMVTSGRPDRLSAHILADCADALEQA